MPGRLLLSLLAALLAAPPASAQPAAAGPKSPWIGKRVVTRYGSVLQVDGKPVDDEGRGKNRARGRDEREHRVYKVEQADGPWLWIVAEGSGVGGWIKRESLIPLEQAVEYYTGLIRADPTSAAYYNRRAVCWVDRKEYDIAIADYNEAIRLEPSEAIYFNNRGNAWADKKEYDRAIADYGESLRLDSTYANAYYNRGLSWRAKKEYDKAIADYGEALRLDPADADAYRNRGVAWAAKKEYDKAIADYGEALRLGRGIAAVYRNRGQAWHSRREHDKAMADYNEALRLDPDYAAAYRSRGLVRLAKKEYEKAVADFDREARLDPSDGWAPYGKALVGLATTRADVVDRAKESIALDGWKGVMSINAAIVGHLAARRAHREDEAKALLDEAEGKADKAAWPYPVVRYLRGEIDEKALLAAATEIDDETYARCYLGFDRLLKGRVDEAREHFAWVRDKGEPDFVQVSLATAELDRLDEARPPAP